MPPLMAEMALIIFINFFYSSSRKIIEVRLGSTEAGERPWEPLQGLAVSQLSSIRRMASLLSEGTQSSRLENGGSPVLLQVSQSVSVGLHIPLLPLQNWLL